MSNLSRERGLTVMYLGNSSDRTHKSLQTQRNIVDKKLQEYSANVHTSSGKLAKDIAYVQQSRKAIDKQDIEFDEVFNDIFGVAQNDALTQFQELSAFRLDDRSLNLSLCCRIQTPVLMCRCRMRELRKRLMKHV